MPELPEVETIKNALAPLITGRCVLDIEVLWHKALVKPSIGLFRERLIGQAITTLGRRGKYFLFDLSNNQTMVLHLKMTGLLLLKPPSADIEKYTTAVFRLDGENDLHFIDQRKFGAFWMVEDRNEVIEKLGPEPLDDKFTPTVLSKIVHRHTIPIKALLCDQQRIAGIGNMYADEALFDAKIHPSIPANALTNKQAKGLCIAIKEVLERGISHNGASVSTFRLPNGKEGLAHTQFRVAHKMGEPCFVCGSPITRIKIRGRGSYFCPNCQREAT